MDTMEEKVYTGKKVDCETLFANLFIHTLCIYIFQRNSSKDSFSKVSFIFDSFEIIRLYLARKFELILFVSFSE